MTQPAVAPICYMCEYYVSGMDPTNPTNRPVCRAFPDGIPEEIMKGGHDHRQPLFDENILFKLSKEYTAEDLKAWEQETLEVEKQDLLSRVDEMEAGDEEPGEMVG
jgi:hypothetical protein